MEIKSITLQPVSGNQNYVYNLGDVQAVISLGHRASVTNDYLLMICNERLALMADARTRNQSDTTPLPANNVVKRTGSLLKASLHSTMVWTPGNYFLIVRCDETGDLCRFDLMLDQCCTFHVTGCRDCERYSTEDMLSGQLYKSNAQMLHRLMTRPGLGQFREWAIRRAQEKAFNAKRASLGNAKAMAFNSNMLVVAHGSATKLGCEAISAIVNAVDVIEGDCSTFFDRTCGNPYENLNCYFSERLHYDYVRSMDTSREGEFCMLFYNLWALNDSDGRIFMDKLLSYWPDKRYFVVFYGTRQEIDALMEQYPSLRGYFPQYNRIEEEAPTAEELMQQFFMEADNAQLRLSPAATDKVCRIIAEAGCHGITARWDLNELHRYVHDTLLHGYCRHAVNDLQSGYGIKHTVEVTPEDIDSDALLPKTNSADNLFDDLDTMVGLDTIKQHMTTIANRVRFNAERRRLGLPVNEDGPYHAIFTGNPGTGKTTVARMMGKMFHTLGLLSKGDVICVDRAKMLGEFIGQTEQIMKRILVEARGNVLFVDEAYTLYRRDNDRDYGRIAVESLLGVLSSKNPDMIIIFAGYEKEMDALFSMNDGLEGRFPYKIHFADYDADQLMQIAARVLAQEQFILTPDAQSLLQQTIASAVSRRDSKFGNARWVNQLVHNGIIPAMSDRVMASVRVFDKAAYQTIEPIDIKNACSKFNAGTEVPTTRNIIGFRA